MTWVAVRNGQGRWSRRREMIGLLIYWPSLTAFGRARVHRSYSSSVVVPRPIVNVGNRKSDFSYRRIYDKTCCRINR